jgi:uncharacterized protein (TIGR02145 family)
MEYSDGERLKFTGSTGDFRTIITDIPTKSKTITFNLMSVIDKDNNTYHIVDIGDQVWMEENLKTTKYRDGLSIPLVTDNAQWSALNSAAYSWYDNNEASFKDPYGALYNGFTVGTGKLCPVGWHVPSRDEWYALRDYLIANNYIYSEDISGSIAKSLASKTLWDVPQPEYTGRGTIYPSPAAVGLNAQTNNSSGFNAFPGGLRGFDGPFIERGKSAYWETNSGKSTLTEFDLQYQSIGLSPADSYRQAGFSVRCIKGEVNTLPSVITNGAYNITQTTANADVSIPGIGESPITKRGLCWCVFDEANQNHLPTIDDYITDDGTGTAAFISYMTGLKPGTFYFIRGYTINAEGVSYGNPQTFSTDLGDVDGNNYNTLNLSNLLWTVENLKTTKLNDNTQIPLLSSGWTSTSPANCYYDNEPTYFTTYGALYNWNTVNTEKLCPKDWHVASDDDWTSLTAFLGGENYVGGRLKEAGTTHWLSPNTGAGSYTTSFDDGNDVHFQALPGGKRKIDATYIGMTMSGMWWTSTQFDILDAWNRQINFDSGKIIISHSNKSEGLSVRCVKKIY